MIPSRPVSEQLEQPFFIDNRPGAGNNIATEAAVRAAPDGYTLLASNSSNAWNAALYDNLNFNFIRDIAPVASTARSFNVMEVNPAVPAKTGPEFIAYARAHPGKINMAAVGVGSATHLYGELFKKMAGVDIVTVQYRNPAQALTEVITGQMQVMFDSALSSIEHIRAGELRALGVTSATRAELLPDIPTVGEFVTGYEGIGWQGISAPRNTPTEIIDKLNAEINAGLANPNLKARLADLGAQAFASSPADFGRFVAKYSDKWGKVIRAANIKAE